MRAGQLRCRMAFDEPVVDTTTDESGSEIVTFTERFRRWSAIEPAVGRKALNADQTLATIDTKITIRWALDVDAVNAKWRGQQVNRAGDRFGPIYDFQSVAHVQFRRQEIDILALAGAASV